MDLVWFFLAKYFVDMVVVLTGESSYTDMAENFYNQFDELQGLPSEFSWDDKTAGGQLLLYQLTEKSKYKNNVQVEAIADEPQIAHMAIINRIDSIHKTLVAGLLRQHPARRLHTERSCLDQ